MQRRGVLHTWCVLRSLVGRRIQAIEQIKRDLAQFVLHCFIEPLRKFAREDAYPGAASLAARGLDLKAIEARVVLGTPGPDTVACGLQFLSINPEREPVGRVAGDPDGVLRVFENIERGILRICLKTHAPPVDGEPATSARNWCSHRVSASFLFLPIAAPSV